jgi:hypothetical protein
LESYSFGRRFLNLMYSQKVVGCKYMLYNPDAVVDNREGHIDCSVEAESTPSISGETGGRRRGCRALVWLLFPRLQRDKKKTFQHTVQNKHLRPPQHPNFRRGAQPRETVR